MNVFIFVLLSVLLALIYILWQQIKQQKSRPDINKSLDKQLVSMLAGGEKVALRLLRHARKNHPGRSYLWYHEKVIGDLERDRRY